MVGREHRALAFSLSALFEPPFGRQRPLKGGEDGKVRESSRRGLVRTEDVEGVCQISDGLVIPLTSSGRG